MNEPESSTLRTYANVLKEVCLPGGDTELQRKALALSNQLIADGESPQNIVTMHAAAVQEVVSPTAARELVADTAAALDHTRTDDAERADTDRLEMLAGVSHELGTPLTVIKANVASIRRSLEENDSWPEELSQREDDVEFAVERMVALRDEVLAASRNEPREPEIGPLNLNRALQRVVRWARPTASDKGLNLTEDYNESGRYAMADEWAVQSILGNLLSNAIRYTPAGGSVSVKTYGDGSGVVAEVSDTGIGIPEEAQPRIFERFYRTEGAKAAVPFGIGLGLAISRDLVYALGGTIAVTSRVGARSTFKFTIPAAQMDQEER